MTRRLLPVLVVAALLACAGMGMGAVALEFDGEVVQLTGAQTGDIVWNKFNFGGFCYNLSDDACVGTETLTIAAYTLEGPDIDRTIDEDCLIYTTSPTWREYELYRNLGLTVDGNSRYWIEFGMGEEYVTINRRANKPAKLLVEWDGTDTKTLATGEEWDLGGGFSLVANQIDIGGDKVWFSLKKNGMELDGHVLDTGDSDLQKRVYTYTGDVAGEDDVPIFSCYVPAVFSGARSNMVQVKYVFLITDNVTVIHTGDDYGMMEVTTVSSSGITLANNVPIDLTSNTATPIMGNLSFKTTDNTSAIEFYPHLIREEPPICSGGGGFVLDDCRIDSPWNLSENYSIAAKDVSIDGDKARIAVLKSGVVVGEALLTEKSEAPVDSDSYYSYVKNGTEIINATLKDAFRGCASNVVRLTEVYQRSEVDGSILINNESYVFKSADPTGIPWDLADGYMLTMKDIGIFNGDEVWLELSKDDITLKDDMLESGDLFEYINGLGSVDCMVEAVFKGCLADVVKLKNVNQYSSTGVQLIENESKTYMSADPTGDEWKLYEGYSFVPKDIDFNGDKAWLSLLKDGVIVKDAIVDSSKGDADRWFEYHNATGALIFRAYLDAVFRGTDSSIIQLTYVSQYSEINGSVLMMFEEDDKKTLSTPRKLPDTWTVEDSGGADFTSIQAAIDAATSGDAIYVYAGTYVENVVVNKQLTLEGEGAEVVTVTNHTADTPVFNVTADYVNISGFTVTGATGWGARAGIYLGGVDHCTISSNNVLINCEGIYLYHSDNNTIIDNNASSSIGCGSGILLRSSDSNCIINNNASNNEYPGIHLVASDSNTITGNTLINNTACNYTYGGLELYFSSSSNTITNNTIIDNVGNGIRIWDSSDSNTLTNNTLKSNNHYGVCLSSSSNNLVFHNNLVNNSNNAEDDNPANNDWHHPVLLEGNYWSDYAGVDDGSGTGKHGTTGDGIGDTDIPHPAGHFDFYPFTNKSGWLVPVNELNIAHARAKSIYALNETITISCVVQNETGCNITADSVDAKILKPDSSIEWVTMVEGLLGHYNGTFTNTSLDGTYNVTIYADRTGYVNDTAELSFEVTIYFKDIGTAIGSVYGVVIGDVDDDGDNDIIAGDDEAHLYKWTNDGIGGFIKTDLGTPDLSPLQMYSEIVIGDLNNDGDLDIAIGYGGTGHIYMWINDGTGGFTGIDLGVARDYPDYPGGPTNIAIESVAIGDIDNDGDNDIIHGDNGAHLYTWTNNGTGGFTSADLGTASGRVYSVAIGDIDNDRDNDIITGDGANHIYKWANNGTGGFTKTDLGTVSGYGWSVAIGNIDNDGDNDIVSGDTGGHVYKWDNNGTGGFTKTDLGTPIGAVYSVAIGDMDNDGDNDIVSGDVRYCIYKWVNDDAGGFTPIDLGYVSGRVWSIAIGDMDDDGDNDILSGDEGKHVYMWENTLIPNLIIIQAQTDKLIYTLNENVTVSCIVQNETGCNITADSVDAKILKPDSSIEWVTMTEGLAGHYNGTFTDTSMDGTYNVTIHAGMTGYVNDTAEFWFEVSTSQVRELDTGAGTHPSISGRHTGTIKPLHDVIDISTMYTYPFAGTGGHSEYVRIYGNGVDVTGTWNGYRGDYHYITFQEQFTLLADHTYNYTIETGSYPQIHHTTILTTPDGVITCTEFVDANGKRYDDWIPAFRLE